MAAPNSEFHSFLLLPNDCSVPLPFGFAQGAGIKRRSLSEPEGKALILFFYVHYFNKNLYMVKRNLWYVIFKGS